MNLHDRAGGGGAEPGKYLAFITDIEEGLESRVGDDMVRYDVTLLDMESHTEVGDKPVWAIIDPTAKGFFGFANIATAADPVGSENVDESLKALKKYSRTLVGKYFIGVLGAKPYKDKETGEERQGTEFVRMLPLPEGYKVPGAPVTKKAGDDGEEIPF